MINKEQQIKNSFIYLLPVVVGNIVPFLTMPIFTRILTKEDYGALALAMIYAVFVNGVCNFGLVTAYERNFFEYRDQKRSAELLYSTFSFVITAILLSTIITYLFKSHLSRWIIGSEDHAQLLFWTFCFISIASLKSYFFIYLKNSEDPKPLVKYTIYEALLTAAFSLFLVAYIRVGVIGLAWGPFLGSSIIFIVLSCRFLKILPFSFNSSLLKESLKLSLPLTPRIFFGVIGSQFDKYMISLLATIGGVGIYSIGQKVSYVAFTFMTAIENVFSPQVYKRMFDLREKGGESIGKYLTPFAYISIAFALMISLFSQEIITFLAPESYHGAIDIITILCMFYGWMFFGKQGQLVFMKKTYIISILSVTYVLLNVALNIPFIIKWGAIGAAWATFTAGFIYTLAYCLISQYYYHIKWEYIKLSYIYLTFFGSSITIVFLRGIEFPYLFLLIIKLIAMAIYLSIGVYMKVITRENYHIIKGMFLQSNSSSQTLPGPQSLKE